MNEKELRKLNQLAEISSLYYEQDLTQSEIAKKMFVSRSRVSRLLQEAKERGIVKIQINFPSERNYEYEDYLIRKFGLKDARIYNNRNKTDEQTLNGLGQLAAQYLMSKVTEKSTLGITWGRTVYQTIESLSIEEKKLIDVVQIIGSSSTTNKYFDSRECVRRVAEQFGGRAHYLNVPLYMEDEYAREKLLNDPFVSIVLRLAQSADIILTGIGSMNLENYMRLYRGYCDDKMFDELKKQNAVGYICAHFYNSQGNILDNVINNRIVGMDIEYFKKAKTVIGVAGGASKAEAIKAAIKGKLINVLISDYKTAKSILLAD